MNILCVSASSGSKGGGELYLVTLTRELSKRGHSITVLLSQHQRMDILSQQFAPDVDVQRFAYRNTYDRRLRSLSAVWDRRQIGEIAQRFKLMNPDVIHINKQNAEDGLDIVLAAEASGLPYVSTIHVPRSMKNLRGRLGGLRDLCARRVLRRTRGTILTIAPACQAECEEFLGSRRQRHRVTCVSNGVDDLLKVQSSDFRHEWGFGSRDLILGCVARIEEQKNPLFLLDLMPRLPEHVKLVWVGDGRLRDAMEARIRELNLTGRVIIDGWREDAQARMKSFDVFVLPSLYEGLPLAMLEATSCCVPVIASRVDGINDVVRDQETGLLADVNCERQWMQALHQIIGSEELRMKLSHAARQEYESRYTTSAMAQGTEAVFVDTIRRWNSGASVSKSIPLLGRTGAQ